MEIAIIAQGGKKSTYLILLFKNNALLQYSD
jgi:hypothetical protein